MPIRTSRDLSGFAPMASCWMAYDDSGYDGAPDAGPQTVGRGPTEIAAVLDLVASIIEAEPEHPSRGMSGGLMRESQVSTCQHLAEAIRDLIP